MRYLFLVNLFLYLATFFIATTLHRQEETLAISLLPVYFVLMTVHTNAHIFTSVLIAIVLSVVEIICVRLGMWKYTNHKYADIPLWLPLLWSITAFFIIDIAIYISKLV